MKEDKKERRKDIEKLIHTKNGLKCKSRRALRDSERALKWLEERPEPSNSLTTMGIYENDIPLSFKVVSCLKSAAIEYDSSNRKSFKIDAG